MTNLQVNNNNNNNTIDSISLLIGCKNNLAYTKHFYNTTRSIYPDTEIVFVSYGSTDGTNEWLTTIASDDLNVKVHVDSISKTLSDTYNKAAELATKEYVMHCHNDMVLAPQFLENIAKHLGPNKSVSYTTIEPPVFGYHVRAGKLVLDLGSDIESFQLDEFYKKARLFNREYNDKTSDGWAAFSCMSRADYLEMGGMDNLFDPMFCEDDDLKLRLTLKNYEMMVSLDAICYHFVSKSSRFDPEIKAKTQQFEINSNRNFIRKWGFRASNFNKTVPISLTINDINELNSRMMYNILYEVEPWFTNIFYTPEFNAYIQKYIQEEQVNTKIQLNQKFSELDNNSDKGKYNIDIDMTSTFTGKDFFNIMSIVSMLQDIISSNEPTPGEYSVAEFITLTVK